VGPGGHPGRQDGLRRRRPLGHGDPDRHAHQPPRPVRVGPFPVATAFGPGARTLYVASFGAGSVTPIDTATGRPGRPLPAGYAPDAVAATSGGVYAVDGNADEITRLGTGVATQVGYSPDAIAVDGTTGYVVNTIDGTVTPVDVRTGKAARPLNVGAYSYPTVITITGQTAVVIEPYGYTVVEITSRPATSSPDHGRRVPDGRRDHRLSARTRAGLV
jgi:hyaluronoglucosaminidase